jgi:endoglucanase
MKTCRRLSCGCLLILLTLPAAVRCEPAPAREPYKGHDLPRLRGAMIGTRLTEADLRVLGGQWKANLIRWQLTWGGFPRSPADTAELSAYEVWLNSALDRLDAMLPLCDELGIKVVIDLHTPPGGRNPADNTCRLFAVKEFQEAFARLWEQMARRYRDNRVIWGYDLVNEPVEGSLAEGLMDWQTLAAKTARRVRAIDTDHAIIIEPAPWGSSLSLQYFKPLDVPKVVYSVHMYLPHGFTHQGVRGNPTGISYPGKVGKEDWDKVKLRATLQPVIEYQRQHNVHIYIGEFSAIRWAPGQSAYNYLRDLIDIFEEHGWDWSYHAFREWDGWSVEHGADPKDHRPSPQPTEREQLLRGWFAKNAKPDTPMFPLPGQRAETRIQASVVAVSQAVAGMRRRAGIDRPSPQSEK